MITGVRVPSLVHVPQSQESLKSFQMLGTLHAHHAITQRRRQGQRGEASQSWCSQKVWKPRCTPRFAAFSTWMSPISLDPKPGFLCEERDSGRRCCMLWNRRTVCRLEAGRQMGTGMVERTCQDPEMQLGEVSCNKAGSGETGGTSRTLPQHLQILCPLQTRPGTVTTLGQNTGMQEVLCCHC